MKQSLRKSSLPLRQALQEFMMQARRTPLNTGFSPSEVLNGRQIRSRLDAILPTSVNMTPRPKTREAYSSSHEFTTGMPRYTKRFGHRNDREPKWIPATVAEVQGPRTVKVQLPPNGVLQERHVDQLQRRTSAEGEEIQEDSKEHSKKQSPGRSEVQSTKRSPRSCHPPDRLIVNSKLRRYQGTN